MTRYLFTGTSTLRTTTSESVGPRSGTRSNEKQTTVAVHAENQAEAERVASEALTTPEDVNDRFSRSDWTRYRRTFFWDSIEPAERQDQAEKAEARLAAARDALDRHPDVCETHPEDDEIGCGWKATVRDVRSALDGGDDQ